jgi:hypothetical protein
VKKNEDGEVELVLGNGQLLGVFFIVVILLALFFGMGYIMGRNSGPATSVEVATVHKSDVKPLVVDSPVPKEDSAKEPASSSSEPLQTPPDVKSSTPPVAAKSTVEAKPEPASKTAVAVPVEDAPTGVFLQIAAIPKQEAELEVEVLRKKSFKAIIMEVPEKVGTYRVLVGPIADGGVNKAREDLQNAGFPGKSAIFRRF